MRICTLSWCCDRLWWSFTPERFVIGGPLNHQLDAQITLCDACCNSTLLPRNISSVNGTPRTSWSLYQVSSEAVSSTKVCLCSKASDCRAKDLGSIPTRNQGFYYLFATVSMFRSRPPTPAPEFRRHGLFSAIALKLTLPTLLKLSVCHSVRLSVRFPYMFL